MKKKAKSKAELQLPELQAIILRTARHLPCFMSLSLLLVPMLPFLVCDRASSIARSRRQGRWPASYDSHAEARAVRQRERRTHA